MKQILKRVSAGCAGFVVLHALVACANAQGSESPCTALFDQPALVAMKISLAGPDAQSLRRVPRKAVRATVTVGSQAFERVAIHLKGGQGSFRPLDEKPAFTLSFKRSPQRFHGLSKIHLNNSVQDPTYLCEDLTGELFRRAGVPAPRVAWATVELNGRKLGLYVLKEAFDKEFLENQFGNDDGNLYDGGNSHHEITQPLELDSGRGVQDRSDLAALSAAAQAPIAERWRRLQSVLDVERFASFMAMEVLANHIDGYCAMQNNFRVYFDGRSGRAMFLPHGTDRMFHEPQAPLEPVMKGIVAVAFIECPEGKAIYRKRLGELSRDVFQTNWMTNRISDRVRLLEATEPLVAREARDLCERISARAAFALTNSAGW